MGFLGAPEIILIILALILFFGANKIPELARGIGQGITEFQKASKEDEEVESNSSHSKTKEDK